MSDTNHSDFFIGWAETPEVDRRFFVGAGLGLMAGTAGLAGMTAFHQRPAGSGQWDMATVRDWRGIVTSEPYPMLRTLDLDGTPRTALLGCLGKCGVSARLAAVDGASVVVKGSAITRGRHTMIAVSDGMDWIAEDPTGAGEGLAFPAPEPVTEVTLQGEILDSKCWFGAMRPSEGKVHKSCASLCIRGGIPPAFFVRDERKRSALLIMTNAGVAHGPDLLPFVADPVEISGRVSRMGDLLLLDAGVQAIRRI